VDLSDRMPQDLRPPSDSRPVNPAQTDRPDAPGGTGELLAIAVFVCTCSMALSLLGLAHLLTTASAAIAMLVAAGAAWFVLRRLRVRLRPLPALGWLLCALPFLLVPGGFIAAWPLSWDEVAYSVALPQLYAARGWIGHAETVNVYSLFPSNYEALTTASVLLFEGISPMRALGLALFAGVALQAGVISALIGEGRRSGYVLVAALILSADVALFAPVVKNDIFNAFLHGFTLVAIGLYTRRHDRAWLLLGAVALGLSVGTKYTSLHFAACVTILLVPLLLAVQPRRPALVSLAWFCITAGLVASPWYLRNLFVTGNPFFPFLADIFTAHAPLHAERQAVFRDVFYGFAGFSYAAMQPWAFIEVTRREFGLLPLLLGPLGMVMVLLRASRMPPAERAFCWFLAALTVLYSAVVFRFGAWAPRYYLVLLALHSVFAGAAIMIGLGWCARWLNWARLPVVAVSLLALGLAAASLTRQWQKHQWTLTRVHSLDREAFITHLVAYGPVALWINRNLPADARVGLGLDVQPSAYIQRPYNIFFFMDDIFLGVSTDTEYLDSFRRMGLTHLAIQEWIGQANYPEANNPAMYRFIRSFEAAIASLEKSGTLRPLGEVDGLQGKKVRFFELAPARH
jgi:hypothetical protein